MVGFSTWNHSYEWFLDYEDFIKAKNEVLTFDKEPLFWYPPALDH